MAVSNLSVHDAEPVSAASAGADRRPRILTFSTLYPSANRPQHGVFVENRLRHLLATGLVEARVVAPSPWFPLSSPIFGDYAKHANVPAQEQRFGITVHHPRFFLLPKLTMTAAPLSIYLSCRPLLQRLIAEGNDFDLIDAHYFYPDGVAAVMLGRHFGKPVTITARGTDINLIPQHALPRRMIVWAGKHADGLITVCQALKDSLMSLGIEAERIEVLRNGVDLNAFHPLPRAAARDKLGLTGPTLLSVGALIERKGHHLIIEAMPALPTMRLLIAGEGEMRATLVALARRLGVADRVTFLGQVAHDRLPEYYSAADALILASSREGWANVLLEAMACGTPVVASNVWGTPEVVTSPEAGLLMGERSAKGIVDAVRALFAKLPDRAATRRYAEGYNWDSTTEGQVALFRKVLGHRAG